MRITCWTRELNLCSRMLDFAAADPTKTLPLTMTPMPGGATMVGGAIVVRDPIGVVVAITPYNAGLFLGLVKAIPALAAGNTVI